MLQAQANLNLHSQWKVRTNLSVKDFEFSDTLLYFWIGQFLNAVQLQVVVCFTLNSVSFTEFTGFVLLKWFHPDFQFLAFTSF